MWQSRLVEGRNILGTTDDNALYPFLLCNPRFCLSQGNAGLKKLISVPTARNKPPLAGHQHRFEPRAPRLRMNKSYQIAWHFDLLVGTNQDGHAMSQHFYEYVMK